MENKDIRYINSSGQLSVSSEKYRLISCPGNQPERNSLKSLQIKPDHVVQLGEKLEEMRDKINGFVQSMQ